MPNNKNNKSPSAAPKPKKPLTTEQKAKRRERNRARRQNLMAMNSGLRPATFNAGPLANPPSVDNSLRGAMRKVSGVLTHQGSSFLKCAFAPPDFAANDVAGVPDDFAGLSLVKRHKYIGNIQSLNTPSTDTYILLLPVPGVAYYVLTKPSGNLPVSSDNFTPVLYPDFGNLFANSLSTADTVTDFRFMSNHIEVIPTVNQMQWTGSIQVMKCKVSLVIRANNATTGAMGANLYTVTGLNGITNFANGYQYTGPLINGMYAGAYCTESTFKFSQVLENQIAVPSTVTTADWGQLNNGALPFPGLDNNFEAIFIKFSGMGTTAANSALVKTWACVEYKCVVGSALYEYQTLSPTDEYALKLYREVIKNLPIAVTYMDNDNFWTRILSIIRRVSGAMSVIPGPYGGIASGVNLVSTGIEALTV